MAFGDDSGKEILEVLREIRDELRRGNEAAKSGGGRGGSGGGPGGGAGQPGGFFGGLSDSFRKAAGASLGDQKKSFAERSGRSIGGALGGALDESIGFTGNAILRAGRRAGREFAIEAATKAVELRGQITGTEAIESAATGAIGGIPIIGGLARSVTKPGQSAADRLKGELINAARSGANFGDSFLQSRFQQFKTEEGRAEQFSKRVDALQIKDAANNDQLGQVLGNLNTAINDIKSKFTEGLAAIKELARQAVRR